MSNDIPAYDDTRPTHMASNALQVFLLDPLIRAYLDATDPMAVKQAEEAVKALDVLHKMAVDDPDHWVDYFAYGTLPEPRRLWYDDYTEADEVEDAAKGQA